MTQLETLSEHLAELTRRYELLIHENQQLRADVQRQREEVIRTHSELAEWQQRYRQLSIAHAVSASAEDRERAKQQITYLIQRVDRAIDVLKS